ncbi:MAG TPA: 2-hydroxyacid dehydrogenase [Actinomycetota bacterium]
MSRLVWVPKDGLGLLGPPPGDLEFVAFPDDPASDPRLGDVQALVPPMGMGSSGPAGQLPMLWGRMPKLQLIQTLSAGVDWIVGGVPEGVVLCSARGGHDRPVAEWVLAAILAGLKDLGGFRDDQLAERWESRTVAPLEGARVLLLGYGSIARAVERRLEPFGPAIDRVARHPRDGVNGWDALPQLLRANDVVVVLLPLTSETTGCVDADFLARMKPGALLVNAARGRLVDTDALLAALSEGRVRAVLDVTDPEPLPAGHPLWRAPGVLITPHVAGLAPDWQATVYALVRDQLARWSGGEPLRNVVDAGY